jgi:hypothetical protein
MLTAAMTGHFEPMSEFHRVQNEETAKSSGHVSRRLVPESNEMISTGLFVWTHTRWPSPQDDLDSLTSSDEWFDFANRRKYP